SGIRRQRQRRPAAHLRLRVERAAHRRLDLRPVRRGPLGRPFRLGALTMDSIRAPKGHEIAAAGGRTRSRVAARPSLSGSFVLQRKAACACGGACPRCRDDAPFQAKLAVSQPGDAFEHEADRIAAEVMGTSDAPPAVTPAAQPQSRRSPSGASPAATPVPESVHEVVRSAGEPLDADTRAFMEVRLGAEFGDVRVHADASAAESAEAVGALAWTVGQHIAFAPGRYAPGSAAGRALLAHELVHVTQQRSAAPRVQRQTAAEADLTVLRAALLEHIRNAIAFTDDEQVRARLTTLRDQAATMTAAQLRAAIPGVQQLAAAGQTAMTSTRAAIQPRAQPSTLDPLVDDADAVIRESRGYHLHQMIH